jgi:RNA polymerase sigma-70 factor (ECF subfamily)
VAEPTTAVAAAAEPDWRRMDESFPDRVVELFHAHFARLFRYLDRLSGDPDLAADLAQETFTRLLARGSPPEVPEAWLITVATNLLRNARAKDARHARLMTPARSVEVLGDPQALPSQAAEFSDARGRVRAVIERLPERDRQLLLLRAEGYAYREIAAALDLHEASVGTLLARAKQAFRELYEESVDASCG